MEFSKVFKHLTSFNINHLTSFNINHLTSFNINVGWYVHMLFLLVMNRFLVIGMIHHSARRRPDKRTMPRQRRKRAGEKFKPNSLGSQPKLGSHTYIYTLFTYIHAITYHDMTFHYITYHYIPLHYIHTYNSRRFDASVNHYNLWRLPRNERFQSPILLADPNGSSERGRKTSYLHAVSN